MTNKRIEMKIKNDANRAFREITSLKRRLKKENQYSKPYVEVSVKMGSFFNEFWTHIEVTNKQLESILSKLQNEYEQKWNFYTTERIKKFDNRKTYFEVDIYSHHDWIRVGLNTQYRFTEKYSQHLKSLGDDEE